jgi:hypothetical protein
MSKIVNYLFLSRAAELWKRIDFLVIGTPATLPQRPMVAFCGTGECVAGGAFSQLPCIFASAVDFGGSSD